MDGLRRGEQLFSVSLRAVGYHEPEAAFQEMHLAKEIVGLFNPHESLAGAWPKRSRRIAFIFSARTRAALLGRIAIWTF